MTPQKTHFVTQGDLDLIATMNARSPISGSLYNLAKDIADADWDGDCIAISDPDIWRKSQFLIPFLFCALEREVPSAKELFNYRIRCINDPLMFVVAVYLVDTVNQTRFKFCINFYADELKLDDQNGEPCVDANLLIPGS